MGNWDWSSEAAGARTRAIVDAVVGAAEAEDTAEVGEAHDEAAAVAPGAEEPVDADGVFVADGEGSLMGEGGVAVFSE